MSSIPHLPYAIALSLDCIQWLRLLINGLIVAILTISLQVRVGMFQSSEDIVEEVANGLHNLVPEGTAQVVLTSNDGTKSIGIE